MCMHYRQQASIVMIVIQCTLEVDGMTLTVNQPRKYYISCHVIDGIGADRSHRISTRRFLWMKLIIRSVGKESDDKFQYPKIYGGYALMMDSASLWTCQIWWSRLETVIDIVLKPFFCCYFKMTKFLATKRMQISFFRDSRSGEWEMAGMRWRWGKF